MHSPKVVRWGLFWIFAGVPRLLYSQDLELPEAKTATTAPQGIDIEAIKAQIRDELRDELKAQIKSELAQEAEETGPVESDDWAEEEWKWEEPVRPELNFVEFDGYFRFRYDVFTNLDLKTYYNNPQLANGEFGPFAPSYAPPVPLCNTDVERRANPADPDAPPAADSCFNGAGESHTLGGANMRLRLEPVLNVYEDIKIKMQIDVLDNLVLGSTPDGFPHNPLVPLSLLSESQTSPSDGVNGLADSIRVKRVWAEVLTPLGQLRVGRMPNHFGLGVMTHDGSGLDSDFGNSVDRLMFATKIGDFYIIPAFDWASSGPTSAVRFDTFGQPFDRDQRDDVDNYVLAIVKRDKPQEIREKLDNDELVLNYGTYHSLRFQALDTPQFFADGDPSVSATTRDALERDAVLWSYSLWFKLLWRHLSVEAEVSGLVGSIGNSALGGGYGDQAGKDIDLNQHGGTVHVTYKLLRDALSLELLLVVASGDRAPGWGVRPLSGPDPRRGDWDGTQAPDGDDRITNYRFDPNFVVDMIFWRQLVGAITDAMIVRPGIQYNFNDQFGVRLDLVYSRTWFGQSTPSASIGDGDNASKNLGLESDLKLFYGSDDGFHAWFQWGLFIPFGGLDREVIAETDPNLRLNAAVAHSFQAMLAVSF